MEDLQARIDAADERAERYERLAQEYREEVARLKEDLAALTPPFQVGDMVKLKDMGHGSKPEWFVRGCARIDGQWVVLLRGSMADPFTFPAESLDHDKGAPKPFPSAGQRWHRKEDGGKPNRADNHGTILSVDGDHVLVQYGDGNTNLLDRTLVTTWFEEAA